MDDILLSRIRKEAYEQGYQDGKVDGYNLAGAKLIKRKKGKWIYYPKASGSVSSTAVYLYPICSECGCEHPVANFCPHCGAKMEKDDAEVH